MRETIEFDIPFRVVEQVPQNCSSRTAAISCRKQGG